MADDFSPLIWSVKNQSQRRFAARLRRLMRLPFCVLRQKGSKKRALKPRSLNALGRLKWNSLVAFVHVFRYVRCLRLPFVAHKLGFMGNLVAQAAKVDCSPFAKCWFSLSTGFEVAFDVPEPWRCRGAQYQVETGEKMSERSEFFSPRLMRAPQGTSRSGAPTPAESVLLTFPLEK